MSDSNLQASADSTIRAVKEQVPARIFEDRAGPAYRTATQLALRQDHAAALDAVHTDINLTRDFERKLIDQYQLFDVTTCANSKAEYLMRPDLGRRLSKAAHGEILRYCPREADLQVVIGDGLSAAAVMRQAPALLPLLEKGAIEPGWSFGRPFLIRYCRVGILNDIGDLLRPVVVVLLIGERPGLMTAESLSAYMAYRPQSSHTDAQRNLISNIHARGVPHKAAAQRIMALAKTMRALQISGPTVKEDLPTTSTFPTG